MNTVFIHLSDIHFRQGWEENQGIVLEAFIHDLRTQLKTLDGYDRYLLISGDLVRAGEKESEYEGFLATFDAPLCEIGLDTSRRICIPGNHDLSWGVLNTNKIVHTAVLAQNLPETEFNDFSKQPDNVFTQSFRNYSAFEPRFAKFGVVEGSLLGKGYQLNSKIGIYCLNTALCCGKSSAEDRGRLAVNTRSLNQWVQDSKGLLRVLVMHHPLSWLCEWASHELESIIRQNFQLCFSGHVHDQVYRRNETFAEYSAPALFTDKSHNLGYSLVELDPDGGTLSVNYRHWSKHRNFVSGTYFSNTDSGRIVGKLFSKTDNVAESYQNRAIPVEEILEQRLQQAMVAYPGQEPAWLKPTLRLRDEVSAYSRDEELDPEVQIHEIVSNPKSRIIKAPPQYGLTCLAHHLVIEAWKSDGNPFWLYIDVKDVKPYALKKIVDSELAALGRNGESVSCVVVDGWSCDGPHSTKILRSLCDEFSEIPLIVMETVDFALFGKDSDKQDYSRDFEPTYLWALARSQMRLAVVNYVSQREIGEPDAVVSKIASDLDVLNLPRTPLNCLMLLRIAEIHFEQSPVNRAEMIRRILFLLFNVDDLPSYKSRPDLKDCEFVLGAFCAELIRTNRFVFSHEDFIRFVSRVSREMMIDIENQLVFDVLYQSSIIVDHIGDFRFRFSYWIYFFAAQHMYHDEEFKHYVLSDRRYISFPEIIEFYTGIDRRRTDALEIIIGDIESIGKVVDEKCGLPENVDICSLLQWNPTPEALERIQSEVADEVQSSKLPDFVKDQYADSTYDRARPYDQSVRNILSEYSLTCLMQTLIAASRALRNSDFAPTHLKIALLERIVRGWEQVSRVLMALAPLLANEGNARFDGTSFQLLGDFGDTPKERLVAVIREIPFNVSSWYKDDIHSVRMGPLLIDGVGRQANALQRHYLMLLLIQQRPQNWKTEIEKHIKEVQKNSFYLLDIYRCLRVEYRYGFVSDKDQRDLKYLIKMVIYKHQTGTKKPQAKNIRQVSDDVLPERHE